MYIHIVKYLIILLLGVSDVGRLAFLPGRIRQRHETVMQAVHYAVGPEPVVLCPAILKIFTCIQRRKPFIIVVVPIGYHLRPEQRLYASTDRVGIALALAHLSDKIADHTDQQRRDTEQTQPLICIHRFTTSEIANSSLRAI